MKKFILALLLLGGLFATAMYGQEKGMYLFSYFKNNGQDGLHLAYSNDGLKWMPLNGDSSFLTPTVGKDRLMRDPSVVVDDKGVYHMVWTSGWWDQGIGYASSRDLKNWSLQQNLPVMKAFKGTRNAWAPELFFDHKTKTFYIFWASTVPGMFPDVATSDSEKGLNHRLFYVTTKDFKTFSKTKVFFNPDFSVIDGTMFQQSKKYYLIVKNENSNPPQKNIRIVVGKKPYSFDPKMVSPPITGNYWAEGPSPLQVGEYVYIYFDKYRDHRYGAVRSKDMLHWEDVSDQIVMPAGIRHGTVFTVSKEEFERIQH